VDRDLRWFLTLLEGAGEDGLGRRPEREPHDAPHLSFWLRCANYLMPV
jgi:hypothetical protein